MSGILSPESSPNPDVSPNPLLCRSASPAEAVSHRKPTTGLSRPAQLRTTGMLVIRSPFSVYFLRSSSQTIGLDLESRQYRTLPIVHSRDLSPPPSPVAEWLMIEREEVRRRAMTYDDLPDGIRVTDAPISEEHSYRLKRTAELNNLRKMYWVNRAARRMMSARHRKTRRGPSPIVRLSPKRTKEDIIEEVDVEMEELLRRMSSYHDVLHYWRDEVDFYGDRVISYAVYLTPWAGEQYEKRVQRVEELDTLSWLVEKNRAVREQFTSLKEPPRDERLPSGQEDSNRQRKENDERGGSRSSDASSSDRQDQTTRDRDTTRKRERETVPDAEEGPSKQSKLASEAAFASYAASRIYSLRSRQN